jgi:phosphoglycolate phosphatase
MSRPLAIFDIDGTLVDSRASIHRAATDAAQALGLPEPGYDRVRMIVGLSLDDAMRTLEPGLNDRDHAEFVAQFRAAFGRMYAEGHQEPLYDGALEHLRRLRRDGWRLALATGQNRKGVARNLAREGWGDLFVSAHCADDGPGKPDPAMLFAALKASGVEADRAVMIGDTAHDARMARNAGMAAYGVSWGFHTADEQHAEGVVHVASDFRDLESVLETFASGLRVMEPS